VFLGPIIAGGVRVYSRRRVYASIVSLFSYVELFIGIVLSIYLVKKIFIENSSGAFGYIYKVVPEGFKNYLKGKDVLTYIYVTPALLLVFLIIIKLLSLPLYKVLIVPLSEKANNTLNSMNNSTKRIIGAISQLPKALFYVLVVTLLLNFYTLYFSSTVLTEWVNESTAYTILYKNAIYPVLNSNIVKELPVLVNDSFAKISGNSIPKINANDGSTIPEQIYNKFKDNIKVIEYFNGVTLDEAVKSNFDIDMKAKEIAHNEKSDRDKAYKIYKWISSNIKYDFDKARKLSSDSSGISSGAVIAFTMRKGICFDFSSLYVSMCRAVGLKVQLITGLGFSGETWGDHAWNRVYCKETNKWIEVDTTFGTLGNYFDKPNFDTDHKDAEMQGEWPQSGS